MSEPHVCDKCETKINPALVIIVTIRTEYPGPDGPEIVKKKNRYCGFKCAGAALVGVPAGPVDPDPKHAIIAPTAPTAPNRCWTTKACVKDPMCSSFTPICSRTVSY